MCLNNKSHHNNTVTSNKGNKHLHSALKFAKTLSLSMCPKTTESEVFKSGNLVELKIFMFNFLQLTNLSDYLLQILLRNPWRAISCYAKMHADTLQVLKRASKTFQLF